jgi:hypothetical protein
VIPRSHRINRERLAFPHSYFIGLYVLCDIIKSSWWSDKFGKHFIYVTCWRFVININLLKLISLLKVASIESVLLYLTSILFDNEVFLEHPMAGLLLSHGGKFEKC